MVEVALVGGLCRSNRWVEGSSWEGTPSPQQWFRPRFPEFGDPKSPVSSAVQFELANQHSLIMPIVVFYLNYLFMRFDGL